jgi:pyruvate/2-oxoglutarate dehydrogenase complex dihydrolipoamide dehydrogenase (E3) component
MQRMQGNSSVLVRPETWDVVVVGGGTAGIVASRTAASVGARVLLIERARTGGDCLWTGCVPSKALLSAARHAVDARRAHGLGVHAPAASVDFTEVIR